jgi:NADPH:quinone reductase
MKAIIVTAPGGPLELKEVLTPVPGPGEVLVKIEAAPVNPSDLSAIKRGQGELFIPFIPGLEGAGVVLKAGKGILPTLWLNKRVACSPKKGSGGTWAEFMLTDATRCFPLNKNVSTEQGSMTLVNPLTALDFIAIAKEGGNKTIINNAAASALGRILEHLCRKNAITLINIVRSTEKEEYLRGAGSGYVLNSSDPEFGEKLASLALKLDARLLFDSVCGEGFPVLVKALPENSTVYIYGNLSPSDYVSISPREILSRDITVRGYYLANRIRKQGILQKMKNLYQVGKLMSAGMNSTVRARFPLAQVQQAIDSYLSDMSGGKVIIVP